MLIYFWFIYIVLNILESLFLFISGSIFSLSLADLVSILFIRASVHITDAHQHSF